jgi:hypothetical protein
MTKKPKEMLSLLQVAILGIYVFAAVTVFGIRSQILWV